MWARVRNALAITPIVVSSSHWGAHETLRMPCVMRMPLTSFLKTSVSDAPAAVDGSSNNCMQDMMVGATTGMQCNLLDLEC